MKVTLLPGAVIGGLRLVAVDEHVIGHKWFFLDDVPTAVDVQSAAVAWAGDAGAAGEKAAADGQSKL